MFLAQTAAHAAVGRETGIPTALNLGATPVQAGLFSLYLDAVNLLVGIPLLVLLEGPLRGAFPRLDRWLRAEEARARALPPGRKTAGLLGLAAFSVVPFLPIGGLTAAVVGLALGYPVIPLALALLAASVAANVAWAAASAWITSALVRVHPSAPWAFVVLMVALVLVATFRRSRRV